MYSVTFKFKSMNIPPGVKEDLIRQKNRTPLQQGLAPSSYEFYYVGKPTTTTQKSCLYSTLEWEVQKY